jgi:hypothetical protein
MRIACWIPNAADTSVATAAARSKLDMTLHVHAGVVLITYLITKNLYLAEEIPLLVAHPVGLTSYKTNQTVISSRHHNL